MTTDIDSSQDTIEEINFSSLTQKEINYHSSHTNKFEMTEEEIIDWIHNTGLSEREVDVLHRRLILGHKFAEIARYYKHSSTRISQIFSKGCRKLRHPLRVPEEAESWLRHSMSTIRFMEPESGRNKYDYKVWTRGGLASINQLNNGTFILLSDRFMEWGYVREFLSKHKLKIMILPYISNVTYLNFMLGLDPKEKIDMDKLYDTSVFEYDHYQDCYIPRIQRLQRIQKK